MAERNELSWQERAICRGLEDTDIDVLFFPDRGQTAHLQQARNICNNCPVKKECRDYALHYQVAGIWGGTTENDRRKMRPLMGISAQPITLAV